MRAKRYVLTEVKDDRAFSPEFTRNFQIALLLSLLEKGMLTRQQFERCERELAL